MESKGLPTPTGLKNTGKGGGGGGEEYWKT